MPYDFSQFKVPVFPNINDKPVEPTSAKAGNGADLINRFNSLVNQLESALNSLPSTLPVYDWSVTLPNIDTIQRLDVRYLNISESKLYASDSSHYLTEPESLLKSFVANFDFIPGQQDTLNISDLIIDNGCGYYFFVATTTDDQILEYLQIETGIISNPRGGARLIDESIEFIVNDSEGMNTNLSMRPLVVVQPASSISITLSYNPPS